MTTGFLYDSRFLDHNAGHSHPERSERLIATMAWLEHRDWFEALVAVEPATVDPKWLETVHDGSYIARADEACRAGAPFLDVPDVGVSRSSSDVARLAAGGAIELADRIVAGDISNGFSLSRPPGHHAEHGMALGFCLFNNVAIAARYLQRAHGRGQGPDSRFRRSSRQRHPAYVRGRSVRDVRQPSPVPVLPRNGGRFGDR